MEPVISPAPVVVSVPAEPHADGFGPLAAGGLSSREPPRVPATLGAIAVAGGGLNGGLRRSLSALGDFGEVVLIVYAVPIAVLAVGIPIVLVVRLAMWTVGVR